jgi:hypothetical protein
MAYRVQIFNVNGRLVETPFHDLNEDSLPPDWIKSCDGIDIDEFYDNDERISEFTKILPTVQAQDFLHAWYRCRDEHLGWKKKKVNLEVRGIEMTEENMLAFGLGPEPKFTVRVFVGQEEGIALVREGVNV